MLVLLALPFVFYASNSRVTRDHNVIDRVLVTVSAPVQWVVISILDGVAQVWRRYVALVGVQQDNAKLRQENARLRAAVAIRREERQENERLRALLALRQRSPAVAMTLARVIATSPSPLFRSLRVDRGLDDGITIGAPVVTYDGVVGRVAGLSAGYADVMLIVDTNSSTDVLVQRTRARARVRGTGRDDQIGIRVQYLPRTADIEPGDILITSGVGSVFPKGLPIGRVVATEQRAFGLYQKADALPFVDFGRIEEVMILSGNWAEDTTFEGVGPQAQNTPSLGTGAPTTAPANAISRSEHLATP